MAFVKAGTFGTGTAPAGGTVYVAGVGFKPQVVLFSWNARTTPGISNGPRGAGFGWARTEKLPSTPLQAALNQAISNVAITTDHRGASRSEGVHCIAADFYDGGAGAVDGQLRLIEMNDDGFGFVIVFPFSIDLQVSYLAIQGLERFEVGTFLFPTATGVFTPSFVPAAPGFSPDVVLFLSHGSSVVGRQDNHSAFSFGMMDRFGKQGALTIYGNNSTGDTDTARYLRTDECIALNERTLNAQNINARAKFDSITPTGFTLNALESQGGGYQPVVRWLALKGGEFQIGNFLSQTATGNFSVAGLRFKPQALVLLSHCTAENAADTYAAHQAYSIGFATGPAARNVQAGFDEDAIPAANPIENYSAHDVSSVYRNVDAAGAYQGAADFVSFNNDGFTLNQTDADPTAAAVLFLAYGQPPPRNKMVRYLYNTYSALKALRFLLLDTLGREMKPDQVKADEWMYVDGPYFPTPIKTSSLVQDPTAYYIESVSLSEDPVRPSVTINTSREASLEAVLTKLTQLGQ